MSDRPYARWTTAALLLVTAGAHVPLIREHLQEAPYIGWSFIALCLACAVLAVALVVAEAPRTWLLAAGVALAALMAFLASRTIGLPEIGDDVGNWSEPETVPALASEALVLLVAGVHLARRRTPVAVTARRGDVTRRS